MTRFPKGERTDIPAKAAKAFAREMSEKGYRLDFSLHSLDHEVDRILNSRPGWKPMWARTWRNFSMVSGGAGSVLKIRRGIFICPTWHLAITVSICLILSGTVFQTVPWKALSKIIYAGSYQESKPGVRMTEPEYREYLIL